LATSLRDDVQITQGILAAPHMAGAAGERWIKASFRDRASAAAFNPEFLQEFCLRIVLDGLSLKVTLTEADRASAESRHYLCRDRGVLRGHNGYQLLAPR
jgi:hypothetical protein